MESALVAFWRKKYALAPIFLHFGSLVLPTFGVLAAVGLMLGLLLSQRTAGLVGLDAAGFWDAGLFAVLAAYVLSRLLLVATNLRAFRAYPVLLLTVPSLTAGGLILTVAATLVWLWRRQIPALPALDAWAPCATLAWFFLALGHLAEGSDPGMPFRYGMRLAGEATALHPVALYAAAFALLLTAALYAGLQRAGTGQTVALALVGAGLGQYLLCFVRQPGVEVYGLEALQWVALGMIAVGGAMLVWLLRVRPDARAG